MTTASACTASIAPKPTNNSPKQKKKSAQVARNANANAFPADIGTAKLMTLSAAIAEADEAVPEAIFVLFDSVITARTAAH